MRCLTQGHVGSIHSFPLLLCTYQDLSLLDMGCIPFDPAIVILSSWFNLIISLSSLDFSQGTMWLLNPGLTQQCLLHLHGWSNMNCWNPIFYFPGLPFPASYRLLPAFVLQLYPATSTNSVSWKVLRTCWWSASCWVYYDTCYWEIR